MTKQQNTQKIYRGVRYNAVRKETSQLNQGVYRGVKWSK